MRQPGGEPTVPRLRLGAVLRSHRESARISGATAARAIRGTASKISRMESARVPVRRADVAADTRVLGGGFCGLPLGPGTPPVARGPEPQRHGPPPGALAGAGAR